MAALRGVWRLRGAHVMREACSSTSPPLKSMPSCAPTPEPTITAVGVARPSAHGHATTRVAAPNMKAIM